MKFATFVKRHSGFMERAAAIAKRRGLKLEVKPHDLGDLYHVYGVNATASKFVQLLVARKRHVK